MIHIIKKGTKQKIQCGECGCLFSFEKEDMEIINNCKTIKCPQCDNILVLEAIR